jgi:drug/metabolite transporter (DMT)-like permease
MNPYIKAIPLILVGVFLNAFAQIAIKKAVTAAGIGWTPAALLRLFIHPWMITCLACYAVSVVLWAGVAHMVDMNYAYPFLALGFLAVALLSRAFLGETIPPLRWVALLIIIAGVGLQAFSGLNSQTKDQGNQGIPKAER